MYQQYQNVLLSSYGIFFIVRDAPEQRLPCLDGRAISIKSRTLPASLALDIMTTAHTLMTVLSILVFNFYEG